MIGAFLCGGAFQFSGISHRLFHRFRQAAWWRTVAFQIVIFYLLFKIGFGGGQAISAEPLNQVFFGTLVAGGASVIWTLFILSLLAAWSGFSRLTQISIAAHFGSVSLGTFVAGLAFMEALNIEIPGSVAVWLAMMELPAILVGMVMLKISFKQVLNIIFQDRSLIILIGAIVIGLWGSDLINTDIQTFLFKTIFTPVLIYFLFEMGRKATASLGQLKGHIGSVIMIGISIPLMGGVFGVSLGSLLGYSMGETFVLALLLASASYVLAPISVQQILNSLYHPTKPEVQNVVAISMALSVGVALPFNVLIGFELYYALINATNALTSFGWISLTLLGLLWGVSILKKQKTISP